MSTATTFLAAMFCLLFDELSVTGYNLKKNPPVNLLHLKQWTALKSTMTNLCDLNGKEPRTLGSSSGCWRGEFGSGLGSLFTSKVWVRFGFFKK